MYNPAEVQTYNFRRALAIAPSLVTSRAFQKKGFGNPIGFYGAVALTKSTEASGAKRSEP